MARQYKVNKNGIKIKLTGVKVNVIIESSDNVFRGSKMDIFGERVSGARSRKLRTLSRQPSSFQ